MTPKTPSTIDYEQCVAYYRAGRRIEHAAAIERHLATHPETARRAARDADNELALAHRFDPVLDEAIPPRLLDKPGSPATTWLVRAGFATTIGLSIATGWWLHGLDNGPAQPIHVAQKTFGQQIAHLTSRRMAEPAAAGQSQPTHPDLSQAGYRFSGRHPVAMADQTYTAFVYTNAADQQVTIYARAQAGDGHTRPDVVSPAGVALARWHANGTDYALTGDLPPASLQKLARTATGGVAVRTQPSPPDGDRQDMTLQPAQSQAPVRNQPVEQRRRATQPASGL